jgi:L-arabinonolactonase
MRSGMDSGGARLWQASACELGESLVWDETGQSFWWVDVHAGGLFRAALGDGAAQRWQFGEALGFVALTGLPHSVVLGLASGLVLFDACQGTSIRLVDVPHAAPAMRINDGRCDRHGNLVFGTMSADGQGPPGAFWRFSAGRGLQALDLPPPAIPNSICFSPDGGLLYFTDSTLKVINVCDYDPATGAVDGVRVFCDPGAVAWEPDGSCVDAAGGLWNAQWGGARIVRYHPSGALDRVIDSPARQPTCPCLGGANLDALYATSAAIGLDARQRCAADGAVLCWPGQGLKGLPEGRLAGL